MASFQCFNCGCVDNSATALYHPSPESYDWTGKEDLKGKKLCCVCAPRKFRDGTNTTFGRWHGIFPRTFLPVGMFTVNKEGSVCHIVTGDTNYMKYAIAEGFE